MRSQTSTEYLIVLAVVIIIALIVVGVLGGIPGIGGGAGESVARAALLSQPIGITGYSITDYDTTVTVRNNNKDAARINSMSIGGQKCGFVANVRLAPGETRQIDCPNVYELEQSRAEYAIVINWTDMKTQTNFTQSDPSLKLIGEVGSEYLGVLDNTAGFSFASKGCWDTSGSEPYPICTCYDLNKTRTGLSDDYILKNNIDFNRCMEYFGDAGWASGEGWEPIGDCGGDCWDATDENPYLAHFYGNSHHIGGLFINRPGESEVGLFGVLADGSTFDSGNLSDLGVSGSVAGGGYTGAIIGFTIGSFIDNSYSIASVRGGSIVGGLIGYADSAIVSDSYSMGSVEGSGSTGGLIGMGLYGQFTDSYSTGSVTGGDYTGGFMGEGYQAQITSCFSTGSVGGDYRVGGLMGDGYEATIRGSYSTGNVNGDLYTGGLVGYGYDATIDNSYTTSVVTCSNMFCGGLVGLPSGLTLTGANTWVNYTGSSPHHCLGTNAGFPAGSDDPNCSP